MKKLYSTLFIFIALSIFAQDWQYQYLCAGSVPGKNVFDGKMVFFGDIPYISFKDEYFGNKVAVMKKKADAYEFEYLTVGGISTGEANSPVLAVGDDSLYLAYSDVGLSKKLSVKKFNGSAWETIGEEGFTPGEADDVKLKFINDTPYVFFRDYTVGGRGSVMKYDGFDWVFVGTQGFTSANLEINGSDFDIYGGSLYCIYKDSSNANKATVKYFSASDWSTLGTAGFTPSEIAFPKIAFNGSTPVIAFQDLWFGRKATVMTYNNSAWSVLGNAGFSAGQISNIALTINNSTPYVVLEDETNCGYSGGRRLTSYKYSGSSWSNFGNSCLSSSSINIYSFINSFVFNNNIAYISHQSGFCAPGIVAKIAISFLNEDSTLGISNESFEKENVFPNPSKGQIFIPNSQNNLISYEIMEISGKKISNGIIQEKNQPVNISHLKTGVYLLKLTDGKNSKTERILKE